MKIKKEFLSLKQGGMSVVEYIDKFTELSRYAAEEVQKTGRSKSYFWMG
jgi:hypothetical protein